MTTAVAPQSSAAFTRPHKDSAGRLFEPPGSTLEDTILHAWEDLGLHGRAECPVCRGEVLTADGCASCGSHLT